MEEELNTFKLTYVFKIILCCYVKTHRCGGASDILIKVGFSIFSIIVFNITVEEDFIQAKVLGF